MDAGLDCQKGPIQSNQPILDWLVATLATAGANARVCANTATTPVQLVDHETGWWKETGWIEYFRGSNKRHLTHAARLPSKDEPDLKQVGDLVEALVEHCVAGLSTLPQELRRWLKSVKMSETDQRPMGRLQDKDSQKRYAAYAKRLVCYSLGVLQSVDGLAVDSLEGDGEAEDENE
jgi:hypothetical protein